MNITVVTPENDPELPRPADALEMWEFPDNRGVQWLTENMFRNVTPDEAQELLNYYHQASGGLQ